MIRIPSDRPLGSKNRSFDLRVFQPKHLDLFDLNPSRKSELKVNQVLEAFKLNHRNPHKPTFTIVGESQGAEHVTRQQDRLTNRQRRDVDLDLVEVTLIPSAFPFAAPDLKIVRPLVRGIA